MRRALLVAAAAVAVVAGSALVRPRTPAVRSEGTASAGGDDAATPAAASGSREAGAPHRARPRSLRGTRTDGGLAVDDGGRFLPTIEARRLFDYFLTATGEMPPEAIRARIVAEIRRRLPAAAQADAVDLLDRYLAYRERVRALAADGDDGDLERRFDALVALRREVLGVAAADAFFADEEARARTLLETRRIAHDASLDAEERARRIEAAWAALDVDLPAETREARATARLAGTLRRLEDEIRAGGGGAAEIQALRERLAGPEAAARLADLDRRRADWSDRVEAYRAARARIADDASLSPAARAVATERLLAESFTPAERTRIEALDRIAATKTAAGR